MRLSSSITNQLWTMWHPPLTSFLHMGSSRRPGAEHRQSPLPPVARAVDEHHRLRSSRSPVPANRTSSTRPGSSVRCRARRRPARPRRRSRRAGSVGLTQRVGRFCRSSRLTTSSSPRGSASPRARPSWRPGGARSARPAAVDADRDHALGTIVAGVRGDQGERRSRSAHGSCGLPPARPAKTAPKASWLELRTGTQGKFNLASYQPPGPA